MGKEEFMEETVDKNIKPVASPGILPYIVCPVCLHVSLGAFGKFFLQFYMQNIWPT